MKKRFTTHGYIRTILLSAAAACVIEAFVNADEVHEAFIAGRGAKSAATSIQTATSSWLQTPQHISRLVGRLYHVVFE